LRLVISLLVGRHERASKGTRMVLAAWLDGLGLEARDLGLRDLAGYAWGRADGLRRESRARTERPQVVH